MLHDFIYVFLIFIWAYAILNCVNNYFERDKWHRYVFSYDVKIALEDLHDWYKYGIAIDQYSCCLCEAVEYRCKKCPWMVIEGKKCTDWHKFISEIRRHPSLYKDLVTKRIEMLECWFKVSHFRY